MSPKIIDYISSEKSVFEKEPLEKLAQNHQLKSYKHKGFWQCMDSLRDKNLLENLWNENLAPWKVW